ncbi:hypothetical protein J6590_040380 [Homalodisca vitripennis]|nr:hypothetical protein J6590_040380 [Homalodisca vitripennis]
MHGSVNSSPRRTLTHKSAFPSPPCRISATPIVSLDLRPSPRAALIKTPRRASISHSVSVRGCETVPGLSYESTIVYRGILRQTLTFTVRALPITDANVTYHLTPVAGVKQRDMKGLVGETIQLPCSVNTETCGDLHSIKWYRGSSRIYVFSEMAGIARAEGDYSER